MKLLKKSWKNSKSTTLQTSTTSSPTNLSNNGFTNISYRFVAKDGKTVQFKAEKNDNTHFIGQTRDFHFKVKNLINVTDDYVRDPKTPVL